MTPALIGLAGRAGSGKDTVAALLKDVYGCMPIALADALKRFCVDVFGISPPLLWGPSEDRNKPFETAIDQEALVAACVNLRLHGRYTRTLGRTEDSAAFARGLFSALHPFLPITTPRRLLQLVGTEWGRALDLDTWTRQLSCDVEAIRQGVLYFPQDGALESLRTRVTPPPIVVTDVRFENDAATIVRLGGRVILVDADQRVPPLEGIRHSSENARAEVGKYVSAVLDNNGLLDALLPALKRIVEQTA